VFQCIKAPSLEFKTYFSRRFLNPAGEDLVSPFQAIQGNIDEADGVDEDLFQETFHCDSTDSENEEAELSQDKIFEDDETDMLK